MEDLKFLISDIKHSYANGDSRLEDVIDFYLNEDPNKNETLKVLKDNNIQNPKQYLLDQIRSN